MTGSGLGNDASPIVIDPVDPRHMYAGGVHSIFFRSTDSGYHWTLQNPLSGVEGSVPQEGLAINPRNPAQIFLGVSIFSPQKLAKTFLSTDYGMSWAEFAQIQGAIESLKFAPSTPDRVYSISQTDPQRPFNPNQAFLYRSRDNGVAWTNLGSHTQGFRTVTIDPTDPDHLYVGTRRGGVIQSFDGGLSFPF